MRSDKNTWIQTWSGKAFDLANPTPEMVWAEDMIYALKNIARFTGHIGWNWSVYDHTALVVSIVRSKGHAEAIPYALLHDAHEAYLGDWSTPLKNALGDDYAPLRKLEAKVAKAIHARAGLEYPPPLAIQHVVHEADKIALMWERRDWMIKSDLNWGDELENIAMNLPRINIEEQCLNELRAEGLNHVVGFDFLAIFQKYTPKLFEPYGAQP